MDQCEFLISNICNKYYYSKLKKNLNFVQGTGGACHAVINGLTFWCIPPFFVIKNGHETTVKTRSEKLKGRK
jgi:hypothetical protein